MSTKHKARVTALGKPSGFGYEPTISSVEVWHAGHLKVTRRRLDPKRGDGSKIEQHLLVGLDRAESVALARDLIGSLPASVSCEVLGGKRAGELARMLDELASATAGEDEDGNCSNIQYLRSTGKPVVEPES